MKTKKENLNTNKATLKYKNDSGERNRGGGQPKQQFGESKFLWLIISIFYIWSLILVACFAQMKMYKQRWRRVRPI